LNIQTDTHTHTHLLLYIRLLAEIPGVARDSRNRVINYGPKNLILQRYNIMMIFILTVRVKSSNTFLFLVAILQASTPNVSNLFCSSKTTAQVHSKSLYHRNVSVSLLFSVIQCATERKHNTQVLQRSTGLCCLRK
jgi:hypothetical protein